MFNGFETRFVDRLPYGVSRNRKPKPYRLSQPHIETEKLQSVGMVE
jgi:hypothetical protein